MTQKRDKPLLLTIDLALSKTGWAIFKGTEYKDSGVLEVSGKTQEDRFDYMAYELKNLLSEATPDFVYVECTYAGTKYVVLDPIIRLQKIIKEWCDTHKEGSFYRIPPNTWRNALGFPATLKKTEELKQYSIDSVKQYLHITVTDNEADAINVGRAVIQKGLTSPKDKKIKETS